MQIWTRLTWTWPCRLENLRVIFFFFFFESHILEHYKLEDRISAPTEHKCSALWIHGCYDHVNTSDFVYFLSLSILYHLRSVAEAGRHVLYVRILTCMYTCAHHVYILLPAGLLPWRTWPHSIYLCLEQSWKMVSCLLTQSRLLIKWMCTCNLSQLYMVCALEIFMLKINLIAFN